MYLVSPIYWTFSLLTLFKKIIHNAKMNIYNICYIYISWDTFVTLTL